ncbi:hypothetical protein BHE74_00058491 [Ensete ventricosum]|nr:hypothetical protein GW17_00018207 [Ensete ventricosum]RWW36487.1 hypothetical protein BHE74_00058491 [Ensete ventricosum]RZR85294.1 hypothetical protein BHM03_00012252 [Ensete ventricosum]
MLSWIQSMTGDDILCQDPVTGDEAKNSPARESSRNYDLPKLIQKLRSSGFIEIIGRDKIFLTVGDAVKACAPKAREDV